jgi:HK97 family phage prohead protease
MPPKRLEVVRAFPLEGIEVARSGDGRTVTAYAAVFDAPYEVRDVHGHYFESISRSAFNRSVAAGIAGRVQCLFNHGRTLDGTPSEKWSMPLGTPIEIKPDGKGLLTVTRYAKTPHADEALELIRDGAITSQSFRGAIYADRKAGFRGALPIVERTELGLRDYGPAPYAVALESRILAVRSVTELVEEIGSLTDEERAELLASLSPDPSVLPGTSDPASPEDPGTATVTEPHADEAPDVTELLSLIQEQRRRNAA